MTRLCLTACAFVALPGSTYAGAQTLPPPVLIRTTYISVVGSDTAWQNVIRTPGSFQSDISMSVINATAKLTARLDGSALIRKLDLDVWRDVNSPEAVHSQSASFAITDDSVLGEVRAADRMQPQRFPSPSGAMIFQWNYLAFLEQLVFRARALGKPGASIPLFFFGTPGDTGLAIVRLPAGTDSAILYFGNRSTELRVDESGRIVSGKSGASKISRVKFRDIFPSDPEPPAHCGTATQAARQALSQPAFSTIFAHYKVTAPDVSRARALNDETDADACRDMLSQFQARAPGPPIGQSLFRVGNVYVQIAGTNPAQAGVAVVYDDNREVARMIPLGVPRKPD